MALNSLSVSNKQPSAQLQNRQELQAALKEYRQSFAYKARLYLLVRQAGLNNFISSSIIVPLCLVLGLLVDSAWFFPLVPLVFNTFLGLISFLYASPLKLNRTKISAYLINIPSIFLILSLQLIIGSTNFVAAGYLLGIIVATQVGMEFGEIAVIAVLSALAASSTILAERVFKLYTPTLSLDTQPAVQVIVIVLMILISVGIMRSIVQSLSVSFLEAEQRARQFRDTSQLLSETNSFGRKVSASLNTIVAQLGESSRQQDAGAQEQAAAVMQVTSSLSELGETARQIADNAARVSTSSNASLYSANAVQASTRHATQTAERGQAAVGSSIAAIEEVRNGITGLAERLMILTDRSKQISSIIALIKEISDETHLLALNAAIESAGAGEHGRRFSVVASQVKNLADRSLEATGEVGQVISELQGAVAAAVLASEETRKRTFGAVERGYQAGQVIGELGQVVAQTSASTSQIVNSMQQVTQLAEEISLATQQQESASRQIVETMQGVGLVAQETAELVGQMSDRVGQIDQLSNQLNQVLSSQEARSA